MNKKDPWGRHLFLIAAFAALLAGNVALFLGGLSNKGALYAGNLTLLFMAIKRLGEIREERRNRNSPGSLPPTEGAPGGGGSSCWRANRVNPRHSYRRSSASPRISCRPPERDGARRHGPTAYETSRDHPSLSRFASKRVDQSEPRGLFCARSVRVIHSASLVRVQDGRELV